MKELNINAKHFNTKGNSNNTRYTLDEILVENSKYRNISRLKKRLISEHKLEYICSECGNLGEWNGKKLIL